MWEGLLGKSASLEEFWSSCCSPHPSRPVVTPGPSPGTQEEGAGGEQWPSLTAAQRSALVLDAHTPQAPVAAAPAAQTSVTRVSFSDCESRTVSRQVLPVTPPAPLPRK